MEKLLRAALEEIEAGHPCVLVTVVSVAGHTPAKPGARVLIRGTGEAVGSVEGGRLEEHCIERAETLLEGGEPLLETYEVDASTTCGGRVTLFLERLEQPTRVHLFGAGHIGRAAASFLGGIGFRVTLYDDRTELLAALPHRRSLWAQHRLRGPERDRLLDRRRDPRNPERHRGPGASRRAGAD